MFRWRTAAGDVRSRPHPLETTLGTIFFPRLIPPTLAIAFHLGGAVLVPAAPEVRIVSPTESVTRNEEGLVTLAWQAAEAGAGTRFELQQSSDPAFPEEAVKIRYEGPDGGSVLTGFPEGRFHFRVRAFDAEGAPGSWSSPVAVEIAYMPRGRVILLLAAGVAVFLATVTTLFVCHFKSKPAA